jgi:hypothetical protein
MVFTGISISRKNLRYDGAFEHRHAQHQMRQSIILSRDKIVPAERPAGRGSDADLEVKRQGLVEESKFAAISRRSHRVFGPHGNDRYSLDPDADRKSTRGKGRYWYRPELSTYTSLPNCFTSHYLPCIVPLPILHHEKINGVFYMILLDLLRVNY